MEPDMPEDATVTCYTPTIGRDGVTRIPKWKYDCVRTAILEVLNQAPDNTALFKNLASFVKPHLTDQQLARLGSLNWHVTTVKLNMEVDREIERVPSRAPQALRIPN
jgi:hypothetical protein